MRTIYSNISYIMFKGLKIYLDNFVQVARQL